MNMFTTKTRGFTLIELLVVIAIIGILAGVVLVSVNSAREKSRDGQRASQSQEIVKALELYFTENGIYPSSTGGADVWSNLNQTGSPTSVGTALVTSGYISRIPDDPRYEYNGSNDSYVYCAAGQRAGYLLFVNLESVTGTGESFGDDSHCYIRRGDVDATCNVAIGSKPACTGQF